MNETKHDYIRNYIIENDLFTLPSRTLAKAIVNSNPELFGEYNTKNIENTRCYVRNVRYSHEGYKKPEDKLFAEKFHGFLDPDLNDYTPFEIPQTVTNLAILNDIHFPFHAQRNLDAVINYILTKKINGILLNGDIIDCYKSSVFLRDPRMRDLSQEFEVLREFIDLLNSEFNCPIFYKLGNHEERIENSILRSVPELVHFVTFENCLADSGKFDFNDYNITIIRDKRIIKFTDNLSIIHGHEYRTGMSNPVGIARWLFAKAKSNAACGHAHRKSTYSERTIKQHTIETHSIGCLCDMTPKYNPLNNWDAGFAIVRRDGDYYKFSNLLIENGRVL